VAARGDGGGNIAAAAVADVAVAEAATPEGVGGRDGRRDGGDCSASCV